MRIPEALRHGGRALRRPPRRTPVACRIYAPVGGFTDLLPYLVRRLLENGANTSFVHQIADPDVPVETLVADRSPRCRTLHARPAHPAAARSLPRPKNSLGLDLSRQDVLRDLAARTFADRKAEPLAAVEDTTPQELDFSIARAADAFEVLAAGVPAERAALLERAADLLKSA